ncbi:hypothetical protein YC2023_008764 [Brassica napus]
MERKKRKGRTPEGVCNGRVSELISQTQISSAIDDDIQSSKVSSKRGVRIGSEYVFYNPHIQKLARAQRRLRLSEKRGQLHKKTDPLPHRPETLDRAARAHRREIISTKRQNPVSANHPVVATEENSLTIASDGIDTTNNVDNYSKRTTSAPNTDERCTENDSLYYGQKNTGQSSVELLGRSCSANKRSKKKKPGMYATQRENLPLPVTKKRKTNPQNVFADITNVNLGCVRGDTRQGETLEVMGQKKIHMEDSQTVFRWRRGWQSNVSSGSVVTSLRDLNGPLHSSQTCQNLPNVQAPIIPSRSQTKETMTENQCLLLGPEEEATGVRLSSRKAKQKGIFLGVSSYASSKPLQFTPDPGLVITQVQPSQSTEQDLHEAEGRSYIISDVSDSDDSLDELWDCSSNEEHDEETDSDTCEDATILQKIQRQANINKVVESITKHFRGNNKKNNTTANSSALEKSLPLPHQEEGSHELDLFYWFFDHSMFTYIFAKLSMVIICSGNSGKAKIRPDLVESIMEMLRECNVHVKSFRNSMDRFNDEEETRDVSLRNSSQAQTECNGPQTELRDTVVGDVTEEPAVDEIKNYFDARYFIVIVMFIVSFNLYK